METLHPGEVHIWYLTDGAELDSGLLSEARDWLSREEREANDRCTNPRSKRLHLLARALTRGVLSRYASILPYSWRFIFNAHGRPAIDPALASPLHFNLSHSGKLVACAVSLHPDIGMDVEETGRVARFLELGRRFFSPEEFADLESLSGDSRRERFFQYWTLKEAYIKARGFGLALPLEKFSFHIGHIGHIGLGGEIRVSFSEGFDDFPDAWRFRLSSANAGYQAAFAVRCAAPVRWIERDFPSNRSRSERSDTSPSVITDPDS